MRYPGRATNHTGLVAGADSVTACGSAQDQRVARQMRNMLLEGDKPPGEPWSGYAILESVRDHKARHGAVMLALEATLDAAAQITGQTYLQPADALTKAG